MYFSHENLHAPSTKEELFQLVKSASIDVRKIRVIGSGHSWSRVAQSEDILLSLHNYAGLVSVDLQEKRVTVKAGTTLNAVNQLLEEYGLAMMNLGSISEQTVAGAISTGILSSFSTHFVDYCASLWNINWFFLYEPFSFVTAYKSTLC